MITQYTSGTIPIGAFLFQPGAQIAIYTLGEGEEPPSPTISSSPTQFCISLAAPFLSPSIGP